MNGLLNMNLTYTTRQHETPIKTANDRMSFKSLEEHPRKSNGSEDGDLMCSKHGPCKSTKQQVFPIESEEIDFFRCGISEEDIAQENVSHLMIDDDDNIVDVDA